jgi:hypothetical protein
MSPPPPPSINDDDDIFGADCFGVGECGGGYGVLRFI